MSAIHDTLFRQWLMIRAIPREPRSASTQEIFERLRSENYVVTDRTVARDLDSLSTVFGYTCEERGRAKHWYWPAHTRVLDIPGMEPTAAMAWLMSQDFLGKSLPSGSIDHLQPYFSKAKEVLESHRGRRQRQWTSVFRVARRGPMLSAPVIRPDVYQAVCEALLEERQLQVRYCRRGNRKDKEHTLHPLALVLRQQIYYLVAGTDSYPDPVHYALHRMSRAVVSSASVVPPPSFDLDAYVETSFQYPTSPGTLPLKLRVRDNVARHLSERPLGNDQNIADDVVDWHAVEVTVMDSAELRWWILGFGDQIIVDAPPALRKEFAGIAKSLVKNYSK